MPRPTAITQLTAAPSTAMPATAVQATTMPATAVQATTMPATAVQATAVQATAVQATAVQATAVQAAAARPASQPRSWRAPRLLATLVATAGMFGTTALVAPSAFAECSGDYRYAVVSGGYWVDYDSLFVPPSNGPVTQEITTTKTRSTTTEVSPELGMSVDVFIAEINSKLGGSYSVTKTVEKGTRTRVEAPASDRNQEIRFGTFRQKIKVDLVYTGCPSGPGARTTYEYAVKEAAAAVYV